MKGVSREGLLNSYVYNQTQFLKIHFPHLSEEEIKEFVTKVTKEKVYRTKVQIIRHPEVGNTELQTVDLLSFIKQNNHRIITPSGTIYESTDEHVAFDKQFIDMLRNRRDVSKQEMLKYEAEGKRQEASLKDFDQSLCKILVNSIIGSNGFSGSAMYDLESLNGVTSMARFGVTVAYTFVERFLTSNFYFPNLESAINYVITTLKSCPSKEVVDNLLEKYYKNPHYAHFLISISFFSLVIKKDKILAKKWIEKFDNLNISLNHYAIYLRNWYTFCNDNLK